MGHDKSNGRRAKAKILLVDDHAVVRFGVSHLINRQPDMEVCGEEENAGRALTLISPLKPDLIVADLSLKDSCGLELMRNLKARHPALPVLVFSSHAEAVYGKIAIRAGARGYLMKGETMEKMLVSIRQILGGNIYVSEALAAEILQNQICGQFNVMASPAAVLSGRELAVFQSIGSWKGIRQIAGDFRLSIKTVEYYREQIKKKLGLKNAAELAQAATTWVQREMAASKN